MSMTLFTADIEIAHRRESLLETARAANGGRPGRRSRRVARQRRNRDSRGVPSPRGASDDCPGVAVPA
jgi:hypothetical protein